MNEKDAAVIDKDVTAEERKTIIGAALNGLQQALTVLQKFGVIDATAALAVPSLNDQPDQVVPKRDAKGHYLPTAGNKPKKAKKAKVVPYKKPTAPDTVGEFVKWFIQTEERNLYSVKRGQWEVIEGVASDDPALRKAHMLVFHGRRLEGVDQALGRHVVCIRPVNGVVPIFNASRIRYGTSWAAQQRPQELAEAYGAVPVPFESVISKQNGAGLDPAKMEVLAWSGPERLIIPPVNYSVNSDFKVINRHFAGAVLLKIEDRYFLFDADREELKHCNFNPFFTELAGSATTIAEAYEKMAPKEVHEARKAGIDTIRQGEFFFTRVPDVEAVGTYKDAFEKKTLEIITDRIDVLGAAVVNTTEHARRKEVLDYIEKYQGYDHANDKPGETIENIEKTLVPLLKTLESKHGPKEAWVDEETVDGGHSGISYHGEGHTGTHVDFIREELTVRLHQQHGADRKFGVQFATTLTAQLITPREGAPQGQGHLATAMVIKGTEDPKIRAFYVRGAILHRGREHAPRYLPGWYRVYTNTSVRNWTVFRWAAHRGIGEAKTLKFGECLTANPEPSR